MIKLDVAVSGAALFVFEKRALKKLMRQAGAEVAATARSLIRRSAGGGRVYIRDGRRYQASQPGAAPVKLSGSLLRGIKVSPFRSGEGVAVRDAEFYALFLEGGAKGGGKGMASRNKAGSGRGKSRTAVTTNRVLLPRPFLSAALASRQASLGQRIRDAIVHDIEFRRVKP